MLIAVILLTAISLLLIYSAVWGRSEGHSLEKVKVQIIAALLGFALFFILAAIDYRLFESIAWLIYLLAIFILVLVLWQGQTIRGSTSWLKLFGLQFQPSELAKIFLLIVLAKFFARFRQKIKQSWRYLILSLLITILPTVLVVLESDLGSALIFLGLWLFMAIFSEVPKKKIAAILFLALISFSLAWSFLFKPYQKERLAVFLSPNFDPQGAGYNLVQSLIAVGSGRLLGRGLGHGPQSQLNFLPEQHTDFIFAVLAEELGFVGGVSLLIIFAVLFWRLFKIARLAPNYFGELLAFGLAWLLFLQAVINIGMNMGLMPITGIPLPLISYGGSALLSYLLALGLAESIYLRRRRL